MNQTTQQQPQTLGAMRAAASTENEFERLLTQQSQLGVTMGFDTAAGFALLQRGAQLLNQSSMVPEAYRAFSVKKCGQNTTLVENLSGLPNCIIALNMAARIKADPLMVMQHLYLVEGRPSWSSQFIVASINSCGRFTSLQYEFVDNGPRQLEYQERYWDRSANAWSTRTQKANVQDLRCVAWATDKETGQRLESPPVTMQMALDEGWYGRNGSKWKTMPELMIRYRAAAFFGRIYAPELLMGLRSQEEELDALGAVDELATAAESTRIRTDIASLRAQAPEEEHDEPEPEAKPDPVPVPVAEALAEPAPKTTRRQRPQLEIE